MRADNGEAVKVTHVVQKELCTVVQFFGKFQTF